MNFLRLLQNKESIDNYIMPLTHNINKYLREGVFPSELNLAKVVPIFKAGATNKITNYMPISVFSFFSKAIITLVNKITSCLDCGDLVIRVFLDLKKPLILLITKYFLSSYMPMV